MHEEWVEASSGKPLGQGAGSRAELDSVQIWV